MTINIYVVHKMSPLQLAFCLSFLSVSLVTPMVLASAHPHRYRLDAHPITTTSILHQLPQELHTMPSSIGRELDDRRNLVATYSTAMSSTEVNALLAFRNSIRMDPMEALANWTLENSSTLCSTWKGVRCSTAGEVTGIDLPELGLNGTINRMIGDLIHLTFLNLSFNSIWGPIPAELGRCQNLSIIDLFSNSLDSELPPELFNLSKLETLELSYNSFSGPLPEFSKNACQSLTILAISDAELSGTIPSSLSRCQNLTDIRLQNNQFNGSIPATFGELHQLESLWLDTNALAGPIPSQLGSLKRLVILSLYGNALTGVVPPSFGMLSQLQALYLHNNKLSGPLPAFLGNCTSLTDLYLGNTEPGYNNFTGTIPEEYGNLKNLVVLYLMYNTNLTGPVPGFLSKCSNLQRLYFRGCSMTSIAPEIWSMTSLQLILLASNQITGELPPEVGNCTSLAWIDLQYNHVSGSIPAEIGKLTKLEVLLLASNHLSGAIPSNLGRCLSLSAIVLADNYLTGDIPQSFSNLSVLDTLELTGNNLTSNGADLSILSPCTQMKTLRIGRNDLHGTLQTVDFTKWPNLTYFSVADNKLTGGIPSSFGSFNSSLIYADFSHNGFTGELPTQIDSTHLSALRLFLLSYNQLEGAMPAWVGNLNSLQLLDLSHNKFSGTIPQNVGNMDGFKELPDGNAISSDVIFLFSQQLHLISLGRNFTWVWDYPLVNATTYLDLSSNTLEGEIPHGIADLVGLKYLILSNNKFEGEIWPPIFQNLTGLQTLDWSQNDLSGPIPSTVSASLSSFNVSLNDLSGPIPAGNQFETFTDSSYLPGNSGLCGAIINRPCSDGDQELEISDYISVPGLGIGTAIGFFAVVVTSLTWAPARLFVFGAPNKKTLVTAGFHT